MSKHNPAQLPDQGHSPLQARFPLSWTKLWERDESAERPCVNKMKEGQRELLKAIEASQEATSSRLLPMEPHLGPVYVAEGVATPIDLEESAQSSRTTRVSIPRSKSAPPC